MAMMGCAPENKNVVVLGLPPEYFKDYWPELQKRTRSFKVNGQNIRSNGFQYVRKEQVLFTIS